MGCITKIRAPKDGVHVYFLASDIHSDHVDFATLDILIHHARRIPKEERSLIIPGDFLDAAFLMSKKEEFKRHLKHINGIEDYFIPLAEEEIRIGNDLLDLFHYWFPNVYLIKGNHDYRYDLFKLICPCDYRHNFDLKTKLGLRERRIPLIEYNDWLDLGPNISITHGQYHSQNHNKKHHELVPSKTVFYGHVHHSNITSYTSRGNTVKAVSLPSMANLNPIYLRNASTNWTNGYATICLKANGHFNFHIHEVWDNELVLPHGKLIKANYENTERIQCLWSQN